MKLSELNASVVTRAVGIYLGLAYGKAATERRMPELAEAAGPDEVLVMFQRDTAGDAKCARYSLRLGNRNYPFMKLLLQEHIVAGEFFFAVDTHDEMEIKPDFPDYEAWMAVRRFNQELKRSIEAAFAEAGLATASTIRRMIDERASSVEAGCSGRILIVDDEEDLARAVESLLQARGYATTTVNDGRAALEAAFASAPDLIVLDYELPEMDGLEVLAALRDRPETAAVPVLLCTAGRIGLGDIRRADGFLAKPYEEQLLYEMIERLLGVRRGSAR